MQTSCRSQRLNKTPILFDVTVFYLTESVLFLLGDLLRHDPSFWKFMKQLAKNITGRKWYIKLCRYFSTCFATRLKIVQCLFATCFGGGVFSARGDGKKSLGHNYFSVAPLVALSKRQILKYFSLAVFFFLGEKSGSTRHCSWRSSDLLWPSHCNWTVNASIDLLILQLIWSCEMHHPEGKACANAVQFIWKVGSPEVVNTGLVSVLFSVFSELSDVGSHARKAQDPTRTGEMWPQMISRVVTLLTVKVWPKRTWSLAVQCDEMIVRTKGSEDTSSFAHLPTRPRPNFLKWKKKWMSPIEVAWES